MTRMNRVVPCADETPTSGGTRSPSSNIWGWTRPPCSTRPCFAISSSGNGIMPQFFVLPGGISGGRCVLRGDDFNHLVRVRRIKAGDGRQLRDQQGTLYESRVVHVGESSLVAEIIDKKQALPYHLGLTLCAALLKGKKFDLVIQKATETAFGIIPVVKWSSAVPDLGGREEERLRRWRRIALEASKQCLRRGVPAVEGVRDWTSLVRETFGGLKIIAHPGGEGGAACAPSCAAGRSFAGRAARGPRGGLLAGRGGGRAVVRVDRSQRRNDTAEGRDRGCRAARDSDADGARVMRITVNGREIEFEEVLLFLDLITLFRFKPERITVQMSGQGPDSAPWAVPEHSPAGRGDACLK